jgi:hypothetical protein
MPLIRPAGIFNSWFEVLTALMTKLILLGKEVVFTGNYLTRLGEACCLHLQGTERGADYSEGGYSKLLQNVVKLLPIGTTPYLRRRIFNYGVALK